MDSARRDRAVELPWSVDCLGSDSISHDCAELDGLVALAALAERARPEDEPLSAMRLPLNLCFFEALPRASVALICDSSETVCLNFEFPLIALATNVFAFTFSSMSWSRGE